MLYIFPYCTPFGWGGVGLGGAMPLYVLIFNTLGWSLPAFWWFTLLGTNEEDGHFTAYSGLSNDLLT